MTPEPTPLSIVAVPDDIIAIAADWHGGLNTALYAIASTGGLTPSTTTRSKPLTDQYQILGELWTRLSHELNDPTTAGALDPTMIEQCRSVARHYQALEEHPHDDGQHSPRCR